jgi:SAM-dependent methyltransferase
MSDRVAPFEPELEELSVELVRDAELYALLHRGNAGDLSFYNERCRGAKGVLELGVGYGRVASVLCAAGLDVVGVDTHAGLLRLAIAELGSGHPGSFFAHRLDMRDFSLGRYFDAVIIPYSGLFCLLDDAAVRQCLGSVRQHLGPGGRLVLDVYEADSFHGECAPEDFDGTSSEPIVRIDHEEQELTVFESSRWDKNCQRLDISYEFRDASGVKVHSSTIPQRYLLRHQLERALVTAGFVIERIAGGFAGEAPSSSADVVVVEARLVS